MSTAQFQSLANPYSLGLGGLSQIATIESVIYPRINSVSAPMELTRQFPAVIQPLSSLNAADRLTRGKAADAVFPNLRSAGFQFSSRPRSATRASSSARWQLPKNLSPDTKPLSREELERKWLKANRHEYRGRWIALDGDKLLVSADSGEEVYRVVGKRKPAPLVMLIPEHESVFFGW